MDELKRARTFAGADKWIVISISFTEADSAQILVFRLLISLHGFREFLLGSI
jgi:hypothetical protein